MNIESLSLEQLLLIACAVAILISIIALMALTRRTLGAILTLLLFLPLSAGLVVFTQDVYSYRNLAEEQRVARVMITSQGGQHYDFTLDLPGSETRHFMIKGDQWRLEGRVLRWRIPLARLGATNLVRLERISNRYADAADEQRLGTIDYALPSEAFYDTWPILKKATFLQNWIDAQYGNGVYAPLVDGAAYGVFLGHNGLFLRAENPIAVKALQGWST